MVSLRNVVYSGWLIVFRSQIYNDPLLLFCRYIPLNSTVAGAENLPNMEDASVFALSGFQYIIMCIVVTKGYPYKKPLYKNGNI